MSSLQGTHSAGNVLVLFPSQVFLRLAGGKMTRVGSDLGEFATLGMALAEAGYQLTYCTIQGNAPTADPSSIDASRFDGDDDMLKKAKLFWSKIGKPLPIEALAKEDVSLPPAEGINAEALSRFDALFIPGGHAPLIDMMSSCAVGRIVNYFADHDKIIAAICHGPLVLAAASHVRTPWVFSGRKMTVFSKDEEQWAEKEMFDKNKIGFYPPDVLTELGAKVTDGGKMKSNVVVDGRLITGQNPASAKEFTHQVLAMLDTSREPIGVKG